MHKPSEHLEAEAARQRQRERALNDAKARRDAEQRRRDAEQAQCDARNRATVQGNLDAIRDRHGFGAGRADEQPGVKHWPAGTPELADVLDDPSLARKDGRR